MVQDYNTFYNDTINTCQLFRPDLALERAKQRMKDEDPDTIQTKLLSLLSSLPISAEEINNVKKNSEAIVKMCKKHNNLHAYGKDWKLGFFD